MIIISKINVKTFAAVEPTSNPKIILSVITLSIDGSAVGDSEGLAEIAGVGGTVGLTVGR